MRVPEEPVCIDLFRQNPVFYLPAFEISSSCRTAFALSAGEYTATLMVMVTEGTSLLLCPDKIFK